MHIATTIAAWLALALSGATFAVMVILYHRAGRS